MKRAILRGLFTPRHVSTPEDTSTPFAPLRRKAGRILFGRCRRVYQRRAAAMKRAILRGLFTPRHVSTPEDTSTPFAPLRRRAIPTLPSCSPPATSQGQESGGKFLIQCHGKDIALPPEQKTDGDHASNNNQSEAQARDCSLGALSATSERARTITTDTTATLKRLRIVSNSSGVLGLCNCTTSTRLISCKMCARTSGLLVVTRAVALPHEGIARLNTPARFGERKRGLRG